MNNTVLTWKWEKFWKNIKIYQGEKLYGHIVNFKYNTKSKINGKEFFKELQKINMFCRFFYITDPSDNKAYCEILSDKLKSASFEYHNRRTGIIRPKQIITEADKTVLELNFDRYFFPNSGTINLYTDTNQELLVYSVFNFYYTSVESFLP